MPELDLYYAADLCYLSDIRRRRSLLSRLSSRYRTYAAFERSVFAPESPTEILYLTESQKQDYMDVYGTPADRFHCLPPGIDRERLRPCLSADVRQQTRHELGLKDGDKLLLMVGSDFIRKGVDRSIKALGALPEDLRNKTRLFVVGRGKERPLKKLSAGLGLNQNVRFLGGREDVPPLLAAADLLLHPARRENTGNAILEAIVAGLPVLATRTCGYSTHVEKAMAGQVIDSLPFRQDQMNAALVGLLTSPKISQWKKNALHYAEIEDLYSRPEKAATIMEDSVRRKETLSSSL
jgi:UDP-glucose:(heptosyl)LPS alpha-1,3-glucosyltransferase